MGKFGGIAGGSNAKRIRHRQDPHYFTKASPVTITRSDGSTETREPYSPREMQAILKTRWAISKSVRAKVLRRDRGRCRYCGTDQGPFEIDHVVPVALGGSGSIRNLVTACDRCNARKGARVWTPRPLPARP